MGNNKAQGRVSARRVATFLAALGALVMSSGITLMVAATPANADAGTNDASYWETLPGEQCVKTDVGAESGGYTVPAEPDGRDWSKLIIKKGSGNIGEENQVFNNPVAGQTYTWQGSDDKQDGGWSHTILCSVPEPEDQTPPTCAEGTDKAGQEIPEGQTAEEFCNVDENPPPVCDEGTDKAGQEIPEGQTAEEFCNVVVSPPAVCDQGTDKAGQEIPEGQTAEEFCDDSVDSTVVVSPPHKTPTESHAAAVTPTVVEAGLASTTTNDLRGEQGLALMVAGMVMLVGAGGLGLRVRGVASRS
jgi:hypothetical protein